MTFNLQIQDVQGAKYFAPDVVPQTVTDAYNNQIQTFLSVYNNFITGQTTLDSSNADTVFNKLLAAKNALIGYATNGIPLAGVGNTASTGYLNRNMARALDTVFKTLDIAGITSTTTGTSAKQNAVQNWFDLSTAGLGDYLSQAAQAGQTGRSIQAMIELEYIKAGNDLITRKLGGLESALSLTQSAVNLLTTIQNLHNKVAPNNAPSPDFNSNPNAGNSGDQYVANFQNYGTSVYNNPIGVNSTASPTDEANFQFLISGSPGTVPPKASPLLSLISSLLAVTFPNAGGVALAFNSSTGLPNDPTLDGSLPASLYQVYHDMQSHGGTNPTTHSRMTNWIVDNMGNPQLQGNYATNLTTAETSAQSLNDQQKQSVQQTLFLFQEFYQSGSGMLTQINQIIQAMAQGCGQ